MSLIKRVERRASSQDLKLKLGLLGLLIACGQAAPARSLQADPLGQISSTQAGASKLLQQSGEVKVGQPFPFFSGWTVSDGASKPLNRERVLKRKKQGYVVAVAASWCAPCRVGLKRLTQAQARFKQAGIDVVVIAADSSVEAKKFRAETGIQWTSVVVDEFQSYASKMCPDAKGEGGLSLPRTFLLDAKGVVKLIISEEGGDYIDQLIGGL